MQVSAVDFVRIWTESPTLSAFIRSTGMKRSSATRRAAEYRRQGIPLKKFSKGRRLDIEHLSAIARGD